MDKIYYIYTLSHPKTKEVRYIGQTTNIKRRYAQHLSEKKKTYKHNWIKSLLSDGIKPIIEVIEITDKENISWLEEYWIAQFKTWGFNLTNLATGGLANRGFKLSDTRIKQIIQNVSKKVYQYDKHNNLLNTYNSLNEAISKYGEAIGRAITNKRKTAYGFIWKYDEHRIIHKELILSDKTKNFLISHIKKLQLKNCRPIVAYDLIGNLIKEFNSIKEAGEYFNFPPSAICLNLKNKKETCRNLIFKYK